MLAKDTRTDTHQGLGEMMRKTHFTARKLLSLLSATNLKVLVLLCTTLNAENGIIM
jgi:hypothetical protein